MSAANARSGGTRRTLIALVGALVGALALGACSSPTREPASSSSASSPVSPSASGRPGASPSSGQPSEHPPPTNASQRRLLRLLAQVGQTERPPYHPGYDRLCDQDHACVFGEPWTDAHPGPFGGNGCDTRQDVLLTQMHDIEMRWGSDCRIYEAWLVDPYTGERLTWRDDGYWIQIDHIYPLAEAWHAGAWAWPQARRLRFANDVRRNLLAVSGRSNDDKGAASPAEWLPPNRSFRCTYVTRYLKVALAYDLTVTEADAATIHRLAARC